MNELKKYLPYYVISEIQSYEYLNEIRLKRDARVSVKKDGNNYLLGIETKSKIFDEIIDKLISHSYHSQLSNIVDGYISIGGGYRVGIAGRAVIRDGKVTNLSDIISVAIRIPRLVRGVCQPVIDYLIRTNYTKGVLIYSPPGVGKTTLLRDITMRLCDIPYLKRVALIDSRKELYMNEMNRFSLIDPYIGYPKAKGIELAIRTMAPDLIVCDEIGNDEETDAILNNQNSGVPIIASAHGSSFSHLIMRDGMQRLYKNAVFGCYMGISRRSSHDKYRFEIYEPGGN